MSARRKCETCGDPVLPPDYAARVDDEYGTMVWCLPCWDKDDDIAVNQYRSAGLSALWREDARSAGF